VYEKRGAGAATCELDLRRGGKQVSWSRGNHSYGSEGQTATLSFPRPIPKGADVVLSYLDRIEPLDQPPGSSGPRCSTKVGAGRRGENPAAT